MQKFQILRGTPNPTFMLTTADLARQFALDKIYKTNLIVNGDAEVDDNWTSYGTPATNERSTTKVVTGNYSRKLTPNAANEGVALDAFTVAANDVLGGSFRVYPDDGTVVSMILLDGDGTTVLLAKTFTGLTENVWNTLTFNNIPVGTAGALAQLILHSGAQTSGDFYFADSFMSKVNGAGQYLARKATGARIRVEENDIRYAFGGTVPTMTATAKLGHLQVNPATIMLDNFDAIKTFRYVSDVTGTAATLNSTIEF